MGTVKAKEGEDATVKAAVPLTYGYAGYAGVYSPYRSYAYASHYPYTTYGYGLPAVAKVASKTKREADPEAEAGPEAYYGYASYGYPYARSYGYHGYGYP